ncbi:unnamed protein product [marine sediment metagenome]|uniref:Uncharacterized protein n=1 Tax=marine sediment metagenome TaxID=412755 RepID=X0UUV3_9ZZZZ
MSATSGRRYAKRITRQLYQNMDRSLSKVQGLHETFDDGRHSKHLELLALIGMMQLQVQGCVCAFYRHAWGDEPSDWYADVGPQH